MSEVIANPEAIEISNGKLIAGLEENIKLALDGRTRRNVNMANEISTSVRDGIDKMTVGRYSGAMFESDDISTGLGRCEMKVTDIDGSSISTWKLFDPESESFTSEAYFIPNKSEWPDDIKSEVRSLKMTSRLMKVANHLTNFASIGEAEEKRSQRQDTLVLQALLRSEVAHVASSEELRRVNKNLDDILSQ